MGGGGGRHADKARGCAFYSFTGILFMGWVGAMITYQPFFITGLEDVEHCRDSAFGAFFLFVVTFATSLVYLCYDSCCCSTRRYGALATAENGMGEGEGGDGGGGGPGHPSGMADYEVNLELADMVAMQSGNDRLRRRNVGSRGGSVSGGGSAPNSGNFASVSVGNGRRPYSDTPYSDTPASGYSDDPYSDAAPVSTAAPISGGSIHSEPSGPTVMVAGMPRRGDSAASAQTAPTTPVGNLLPGFSEETSDGSGEEEESDEEGQWAASPSPAAPPSGNGAVDLLS